MRLSGVLAGGLLAVVSLSLAEVGEGTWKTLEEARALREELGRMLPALAAKGVDAYARMEYVSLTKQLEWTDKVDLLSEDWCYRAVRNADELVRIGKRAVADARRALAGEMDCRIPRFETGPVQIFHAMTLANRVWPDGHRDRGPLFFTGYGHFTGARREMADFPDMGLNILQMELGTRRFVHGEDVVSTNAAWEFLMPAARAAKANVRMDLLLSPHYFPGWALEKWPELKTCSGGFFGYCVHDPHGRAVQEKYLRALLPLVKDSAALHGICLSNEPRNENVSNCAEVRRLWPGWLRRKFGSEAEMNRRWGTSYGAFAEVPLPVHPDLPSTPAALEFVRFNRSTFADFHDWMAGIVRELAPGVPLHSKVVMDEIFSRQAGVFWSIDPDRFAAFSDYLDCDPLNFVRNWGETGKGIDLYYNRWWANEASYDFLRSMADKPVFDSENHNIEDRWKLPIEPEHVYSVLWQNAIHGQSCTAFWTYERSFGKKEIGEKQTCHGLILERPECFVALNRCALDLNRLVDRLAPIMNQQAGVIIHHSLASQVLSGGDGSSFIAAYRAASNLGQTLGVVTDERLERVADGELPRPLEAAKVVVLPDVTHLSDKAYEGLRKLEKSGIRVVACGKGLEYDDCAVRREGRAFPCISESLDDVELSQAMFKAMPSWGLRDLPRVRVPGGRDPVVGVETRGYSKKGRSYLSICNHLRKPVKVQLPSAGRDLISGEAVPAVVEVRPLMPMFVEMEESK